MSILLTPQTKVLVQGITGSFGARHTKLSLEYGTQIVAGVTPGKGGQLFENQVPIFDTVAEAIKATSATAPGWLSFRKLAFSVPATPPTLNIVPRVS